MGQSGKERAVKCEGRFGTLRELLYTIVPEVMQGGTVASIDDLKSMWDLIQDEIPRYENYKDPYFNNGRADTLRLSPPDSYLALVPLLESSVKPGFEPLIRYCTAMNCGEDLAMLLYRMSLGTDNLLRETFGKETKSIQLPEGGDLRGYRIKANVGIGTISHGGTHGGGVRSDSPFLLEVYHDSQDMGRRGETDLAAVIGFWAQNDSMLVSQMQPCKNAHYPPQTKFGVASLHIAESMAKLLGFKTIQAYSAHNHPLFLEHPDSRVQLMGEFRCMWDTSSHKLNFDGCPTKNYSKDLSNGQKKHK